MLLPPVESIIAPPRNSVTDDPVSILTPSQPLVLQGAAVPHARTSPVHTALANASPSVTWEKACPVRRPGTWQPSRTTLHQQSPSAASPWQQGFNKDGATPGWQQVWPGSAVPQEGLSPASPAIGDESRCLAWEVRALAADKGTQQDANAVSRYQNTRMDKPLCR